MKWLTGVYASTLCVIVILADRKDAQFLFRPVRNLPYGDKVGHLILMGLFSLIVNMALSCKTIKPGRLNPQRQPHRRALRHARRVLPVVHTLQEL
jgi:hypothetical protein